ncbi:gene transfer agent family protein [Cognatishimia activa]|uniref:gene transfer agent family protein n=1 Tax=Cognatishimia activa TaxID=1715691 RepID=UPI00223257FA|nr:gene transfer agent family protein [Cognatishimia activa]UZD92398.1 gene transfer agent family protein [Cognatishimia activa]
MANPHTGEIALVVNGERCLAKLTLGALAGLETRLETGSLMALVERFEGGRFSASDVISLLYAGLSACGWEGAEADLAEAEIEGGPMQAARLAARMLAVAFVVPGEGDGAL